MLKKVSSHLKTMATGFLGNTMASSLTSGFSKSQGKVAAELLKKSPFETPSSPTEKIKADPLAFSNVQYPSDLTSNESGHYILFYAISNNYGNQVNNDFAIGEKLGFQRDALLNRSDDGGTSFNKLKNSDRNFFGNNVKDVKNSNSVLSKFPTHSTVTAAIALYMPPGVSVSYGVEHGKDATELSGGIAAAAGNISSLSNMGERIAAGLGAGVSVANQTLRNLAGTVGAELGVGNPTKLVSKAFGVAVNSHEEMFFEGVPFRTFDYDFEFWPKNKKEVDAVKKIIFLFKYHMHPEIDLSMTGSRMFRVPSEFEIQYAYLDQANEYLNKISRVVCTKCNVSYGDENQYSTFEKDPLGAAPVKHTMSLTFKETEIMTKSKIVAGY
jgi:hypothetical protein